MGHGVGEGLLDQAVLHGGEGHHAVVGADVGVPAAMYDAAREEPGEGGEVREGLMHEGELVRQLSHLVILLALGDDAGDQEARVRLDEVHVGGIEAEEIRGDELVRLLDEPLHPCFENFGPAVGQKLQTLPNLFVKFRLLDSDGPGHPCQERCENQRDDGGPHDQFGPVPAHGGRRRSVAF